MDQIAITTPRLTLRAFRASDASRVAQLLNELDVTRWLTRVPYPYAEQDAVTYFSLPLEPGQLKYMVCVGDDVIGCVTIESELGYWYGKPFWGQGYATEAARALVTAYFARTDDVLMSGYILGNTGSQHVLEKLGFAPDVERNVYSVPLDTQVKVQGMFLTKQAWEAAQ